jgi:hypothetical protein
MAVIPDKYQAKVPGSLVHFVREGQKFGRVLHQRPLQPKGIANDEPIAALENTCVQALVLPSVFSIAFGCELGAFALVAAELVLTQ